MATRTQRSSAGGSRKPLTTERVLQAALVLADREGVDELSMRKLARALGYEVMSLYNHVANKDVVLAGIADLVAAEIEPPETAPARRGKAAWKAGIRHTVLSAHDALDRHPWVVALWPAVSSGPHRLRFMEGLLRSLRAAGLSPTLAYHGYHALMMHILGFALLEQRTGLDSDNVADAAAEFLAQFEDQEFPNLIEHMHQHVHAPAAQNDFEFVLDVILDGLDRLR